MKTQVLFLDFDGVLNTWRTRTVSEHRGPTRIRLTKGLDPRNVAHLNVLCRRNPALRIVISSAWREAESLPSLRRILAANGFRYAERVIGITPIWVTNVGGYITGFYGLRGDEIRGWLERHPGITTYAILDDMGAEEFPGHEGHFVQTSPYRDGLNAERVRAVEAALRSESVPALPKKVLMPLRHEWLMREMAARSSTGLIAV